MHFTEEQIQARLRLIGHHKKFKDFTSDQIRQRAIDSLNKTNMDIDITSLFNQKKEQKDAQMLFQKYMSDYTIESISDKNTLREVIYLEIVQQRLQAKMNEYYDKDSKAVPMQLMDTIHKNSKAILELKNNLGLNRAKTVKSGKDAFQHLIKRIQKWRSENTASRNFVCPCCGKMVLLKIKTDCYDAQGHPFFKDRTLYNKHLLKMYWDKRITKQDVAKVLECSTDYVNWVLEKIEGKILDDGVSEEEKKTN